MAHTLGTMPYPACLPDSSVVLVATSREGPGGTTAAAGRPPCEGAAAPDRLTIEKLRRKCARLKFV